ncbi:hypothetical protein [Cupriavidus necator]
MSLETFHTRAAQSLAGLRQVPARIAARIFRVDQALALEMQAWISEAVSGPIPETFMHGNAVPCFALISIAARKPAVFWVAFVAIPALPLLLCLRWI